MCCDDTDVYQHKYTLKRKFDNEKKPRMKFTHKKFDGGGRVGAEQKSKENISLDLGLCMRVYTSEIT